MQRTSIGVQGGGRVWPGVPPPAGGSGPPQVILKFYLPGGAFWCIFRNKMFFSKVVVNFILTKKSPQFHMCLKKIHS